MTHSPLDLISLASFHPEQTICPNCRASYQRAWDLIGGDKFFTCRICTHRLGRLSSHGQLFLELQQRGYILAERLAPTWDSQEHFLSHLNGLGRIAQSIEERGVKGVETLEKLLGHARLYVHFLTYGAVSAPILRLLVHTSRRIPIVGVIANSSKRRRETQREAIPRSTLLNLRVVGAEDSLVQMPHGKLLIIDGMLAITGSLNLSVVGWERARRGLEIVHVLSVPDEVIALNNRFFAPAWMAAAPRPERPRRRFGRARRLGER